MILAFVLHFQICLIPQSSMDFELDFEKIEDSIQQTLENEDADAQE